MGRKQHIAKARADVPLLPPLEYAMMTGKWPPIRVHGWAEAAAGGQSEEMRRVDDAWAAHRDTLIATTRAYGFEPGRIDGSLSHG